MSDILVTEVFQTPDVELIGTFDVAIGYCSADMRSIQNLLAVQPKATRRHVFTGDSLPDRGSRRGAYHLRKVHAYKHEQWSDQTPDTLSSLFKRGSSSTTRLTIFIDVSAFPRTALAVMIQALKLEAERGTDIELTMGYCLASYSAPPSGEQAPNRRVAPVHPMMAGWTRNPKHPVTLIVGLGYERGKALGAVEYIQPADLCLFVPQSPEEKYLAQVHAQNKDLLAAAQPSDRFDYKVLEPAVLLGTLTSLVAGMVDKTKPVLLPFGPKIFFAVSLLLSLQFPEIAVWHVSGEEDQPLPARKPSGHSVFLRCVLSSG